MFQRRIYVQFLIWGGGELQYPGRVPKLRHWINYKRKTKGTRL